MDAFVKVTPTDSPTDGNTSKVEASKTSMKATDTGGMSKSGDNLKADKFKFGKTTLERGDDAGARKLVADARASGEITTTGGKTVDINSPAGKGEIAKIQALGRGADITSANKIGADAQKTAESISKLNAIRGAQGKPPVGGKPMDSGDNKSKSTTNQGPNKAPAAKNTTNTGGKTPAMAGSR